MERLHRHEWLNQSVLERGTGARWLGFASCTDGADRQFSLFISRRHWRKTTRRRTAAVRQRRPSSERTAGKDGRIGPKKLMADFSMPGRPQWARPLRHSGLGRSPGRRTQWVQHSDPRHPWRSSVGSYAFVDEIRDEDVNLKRIASA